MIPAVHQGRRRNQGLKMTSTLDKPKKRKGKLEENIMIHSEAKLYVNDNHIVKTPFSFKTDDPDYLRLTSWSDDKYQFGYEKDLRIDHSAFRFFKPGTVMSFDFDPCFQYFARSGLDVDPEEPELDRKT